MRNVVKIAPSLSGHRMTPFVDGVTPLEEQISTT